MSFGSVVIRDPRETVTVRDDRVTVVAIASQGPQGPTPVTPGSVIAAPGDLIVGDALGDPDTLAVGANASVLTVVDGVPTWAGQVWYVDAAADIQSALDEADAAGGGIVQLSAGTFGLVDTLLIDSWVTLRGSGPSATILRLGDTENKPVIKTRTYDALTGTNSAAGEHNFTIADLTIDGNEENNAGSAGYGALLYGYGYYLTNVVFRNCNADGLRSEWGSAGGATGDGADQMEAYLVNVKCHSNEGNGIDWQGPHDSQWTNVLTFNNGVYGLRARGNGGAVQCANFHSWGASQQIAAAIEASSWYFVNAHFEGATETQLYLGNGAVNTWVASALITPPGILVTATNVGITVNGAANNDCYVNAHFFGCLDGCVDFIADAGNSRYGGIVSLEDGYDIVVGTPHADTELSFVCNNIVTGRGSVHVAPHVFREYVDIVGVQYVAADGDIQAALDAAGVLGGGIVQLAPGVFEVSGLLIDSNVWLRGSGVDATTLKIPDADDYPCILTREFGDHSGTNDTDSEVNFKISDLTIDGNKSGNPSGAPNGYGMRLHGANFSLERLRIHSCNATGIDSEWSNDANPPTTPGMTHAMESRLIDVEVHECDGTGIYWNGPHDSMWWGCIAWENGAKGFYVNVKGASLIATACHSWGNDQTHAWYLDGIGCHLVGCTGEGASVCQVYVGDNDCAISGGVYFGAGASVPVGIHLDTCAGYMIQAKLMNCTSGAIKYTADVGLGWIEALVYQASGAAESGTPHASSHRIIRVFGGGTGDVNAF